MKFLSKVMLSLVLALGLVNSGSAVNGLDGFKKKGLRNVRVPDIKINNVILSLIPATAASCALSVTALEDKKTIALNTGGAFVGQLLAIILGSFVGNKSDYGFYDQSSVFTATHRANFSALIDVPIIAGLSLLAGAFANTGAIINFVKNYKEHPDATPDQIKASLRASIARFVIAASCVGLNEGIFKTNTIDTLKRLI